MGTLMWGDPLIPQSPEPAILVMHHSMKPHPAITATLLDFMCRVSATALFPPRVRPAELSVCPSNLGSQ